LTDSLLRKEYDYFRERPDEYFHKYGSNVLYKYAPKSDLVAVLLIILLFGCIVSWFVQKKKYLQVCERLIHDALEDLQIHEGGSKQSMDVRREAEEILMKNEEHSNGSVSDGKPNSKKVKFTKKELKEKEKEKLKPIIEGIVYNIKDFGSGFHHPTWRDILIVRMVMDWPKSIANGIAWETRYYYRRLRKFEFNDDEKQVLTQRAVGPIFWAAASDEQRLDMLAKKLWITDNLVEWKEIRQMSTSDQKRYLRSKKRNKGLVDDVKSD